MGSHRSDKVITERQRQEEAVTTMTPTTAGALALAHSSYLSLHHMALTYITSLSFFLFFQLSFCFFLSSVSKIRLFIFFTSPSSHTCSFITQVFIFYVSVCLTLTFLLLLFTCIVCFEVLHFLHTTEKELDLHYDHVKYIHSATH